MRRLLAAASLLIAFAGAAHWVVPVGAHYYALLAARDDAAALADLQLAGMLDKARVAEEISGALAQGDAELAQSFLDLADSRAVPVDAALRAQVAAANSAAAQASRQAGAFGKGYLTGEVDDVASLAGSVAGDLTVWGDVRDLGRQTLNWARGEPVDELMVGLGAVGIVATGATWTIAGAPAILRAGVTALKGARRAGVLSARLVGNLADVTRGGRRAQAVATVTDLGRASSKAGMRATFAGLTHVDDAAGAARLARLADVKGGKTLAIVKLLGRGALFLTEALAKLAFWTLAALVNLIGLISAFNSFVVALVRPLWKRPRGALA